MYDVAFIILYLLSSRKRLLNIVEKLEKVAAVEESSRVAEVEVSINRFLCALSVSTRSSAEGDSTRKRCQY